jgi:hypothetical protein
MKYPYYIYDNVVDKDLQKEVWQYIINQTFYAKRKDGPFTKGTIITYKPIDNKKEYLYSKTPSVENQYMHRAGFGDSEEDIKIEHPILFKLWESISKTIGKEWTISGNPEHVGHTRLINGKEKGEWRVYVNAQPTEEIKKSHTIHRDSIDMKEDTYYTLLYTANLEWHPSWFAENIFYEDDFNSEDKQQFQKGYGQCRDFGIGDPYAIVSPKPGRIVMYDSRTLHTTRPAALWSKEMRYAVAFRIRKTG